MSIGNGSQDGYLEGEPDPSEAWCVQYLRAQSIRAPRSRCFYATTCELESGVCGESCELRGSVSSWLAFWLDAR